MYSNPLRIGCFRRRMILWTSASRPCRSSGCDPQPACVVFLASPRGETRVPHGVSAVSECPAQAPHPNCPPTTSTPVANSNPSVPSPPPNDPSDIGPARRMKRMHGASSLEKKYRTSRAGYLDASLHITFQKSLRSEASRQLVRGPQPPGFTPPSPQPC
jgi:hypothetical protein